MRNLMSTNYFFVNFMIKLEIWGELILCGIDKN